MRTFRVQDADRRVLYGLMFGQQAHDESVLPTPRRWRTLKAINVVGGRIHGVGYLDVELAIDDDECRGEQVLIDRSIEVHAVCRARVQLSQDSLVWILGLDRGLCLDHLRATGFAVERAVRGGGGGGGGATEKHQQDEGESAVTHERLQRD